MERGDGGEEQAGDTAETSAASPDAWRCERCGGTHTRRQRCPLDPPPTPPESRVDSDALIARLQRSDETHARSAPVDAVWAQAREFAPALSPYLASQRRAAARPALNPVGGVQNAAVQWLSAMVCTSIVITCLSVTGVYIDHMTEADLDPATQLAGALIAIAIGFGAGALPLYFTARAFSGPAYALLALTLLTGGLIMLMIAPIVRQMNTPGLAEYRGFRALLTFGLVSTLCGAALAAVCVRWSLYRESREKLGRWSRPFAAGYGVLLILTAGLFGLLIPLAIGSESDGGIEQSVAQNAIIFASLIVLMAGPGIVLMWHGIGALRGWPSRELRMPVPLICAALFAVVLGLGHLIMRAEKPVAAPMPVLHVLGAALPGVTYAALAARGSLLGGSAVRGLNWRQITTAAAISASVAVAIAVYVESLGSTIAVALLLVNSGAFEFAQSAGDVTDVMFEYSDFQLSDTEQLVANLIAAAVLAPVVEEFAKSLGVRFLMGPASTRAQCFLLGAVAGAAFGFLEALLYGAGWIADDLGAWWQGIAVRAGSTSGHVLWTGVTGIAWWYWSIARRHRVAVLLFGVAMLAHGAWNGVFTIIDSRIFFLEELDIRTIEIIAYVIVGAWSLAQITAIPVVARRMREAPAPIESTPLASMQAWLA